MTFPGFWCTGEACHFILLLFKEVCPGAKKTTPDLSLSTYLGVFIPFKSYCICVCASPCAVHALGVRGQRGGAGLYLFPCGSWRLNSGHQGWQQAPSPAEPSCQPHPESSMMCFRGESSCASPFGFDSSILVVLQGPVPWMFMFGAQGMMGAPQLRGHIAQLQMRADLVSVQNTLLRGNFFPIINPLGN